MNFSRLTKRTRDKYVAALIDYWQLSFQRCAFIQLARRIDAIICSVQFEPVTEELLVNVNDRACEVLREWANMNKDCPALSDTSRFWVKIGVYPNFGTNVLRMEVSDELRYLSTGTCDINLVSCVDKWPDQTLKAAYCREILKEES